jgi:hypothetical protein
MHAAEQPRVGCNTLRELQTLIAERGTVSRPAVVQPQASQPIDGPMEKTAQKDRVRQLGPFWERVALPRWGDLIEPTRVEAVRLLAQLLRKARAGEAGLRSEGVSDD